MAESGKDKDYSCQQKGMEKLFESDKNDIPIQENPFRFFAALTGVALGSAMGGFFFALATSRRKHTKAFKNLDRTRYNEDPFIFAMKAFAWGSALAIGGTGTLVLSVKSILGVSSTREFGDKMKYLMSSKTETNQDSVADLGKT